MKYNHSEFKPKRRRRPKTVSLIGTGIVVLILILLFVYGVALFNKEEEPEELLDESITEIMTPTPTDVISEKVEIEGLEKITLRDVRGRGGSGEATRSMEDEKFVHTVKATLPEIDREAHFYEGWLLRRVPFTFFSTGEMVTNDDGEFVLEWESEVGDDFSDYKEVVITLEQRDDNPDPSTHYLEGTFE